MSGLYLDIVLCSMAYLILIGFIFWRTDRRKGPDDNSNDGDGGLPIENGPKLDLPPGVCLPGDGPRMVRRDQYDEIAL